MELWVDRGADTPLFAQLKSAILAGIQMGTLRPGEPIPTEMELQVRTRLSRATIRQAVGDLVAQGFLYRERGRGTFVTWQTVRTGLHSLVSFTESMRIKGRVPGARLLEFAEQVPPAAVANALGLTHAERVLKIERLRTVDDEPIGLHTSYLPLRYGLIMTEDELRETGSLYALLAHKYHITFSRAEATVEAILAEDRQAALLDLKRGGALLLVEQVTFSADGRPIEFAREVYRGDRYKYSGVRRPELNLSSSIVIANPLAATAGSHRGGRSRKVQFRQ